MKSDWPKTTDMDFWSRTSKFVQDRTKSTLIRTGTLILVQYYWLKLYFMFNCFTGSACRSKVCRQLSQLYPNPLCAKKELQSDIPCPTSKDDAQSVLTAMHDECVPQSAPFGSIKVCSVATYTAATSSQASSDKLAGNHNYTCIRSK